MVAFAQARLAETEAAAKAISAWDWSDAYAWAEFSPEVAAHFRLHHPAKAVREIETTRLLIAEILSMPHTYIDGDTWFSCSQAVRDSGDQEPGSGCADEDRAGKPCDCGRDRRVGRMLGSIVSRWDDHPDYQKEAWKP